MLGLLQKIRVQNAGALVFSFGYNSDLDRDLFSGSLIGKMDFLLRLSTTSWRQASATEVVNCKYGSPYRAANAVAILSYTCP